MDETIIMLSRTPDNVYRYDEQFNQVDYQFVNIDSRGIVQHPVDGKLYMKNYWSGNLSSNTDPDGTAEYLYSLFDPLSAVYTLSGWATHFHHQNGLIKKYDFSTGQLVESLTFEVSTRIAHTGEYLIFSGGGEILNAYDEHGNWCRSILSLKIELLFNTFLCQWIMFYNRGGYMEGLGH